MDGISPASAERRMVDRDGVEMHCTDRSDGPPVVVLAS